MSLAQHFLRVQPRSIQFVDYQAIEWQKVKRTHYSMYQRFRYQYPGPISDLHQKLTVIPPARHGNQLVEGYKLVINSPEYALKRSHDQFGNIIYCVDVPLVEDCIDFEIWCSVERKGRGLPLVAPDKAVQFLNPTPLTTPDDNLREIAHHLAKTTTNLEQLAENISNWVWEKMHYAHGVTNVSTPAAEALAIGKGLCQDYSQIMITLCRLVGLPARYVSGHMLGEGGSHAWVEVLLPSRTGKSLGAVAFDPTNHCRAGLKHITIAVGRDYRDVSPTSGYYTAPYAGQLSSSKQAGLITVEYLDGETISLDEQFLVNVNNEDERMIA